MPTGSRNGLDVVAGQVPPRTCREAFVEENPHSSRGKRERIAGFLKERNRLLAADRWKIFQEILQCVTTLEIIKQRAGGNARSGKAWSPAHDFRVNLHNGTFLHASKLSAALAV
jgi:hypothetical protein